MAINDVVAEITALMAAIPAIATAHHGWPELPPQGAELPAAVVSIDTLREGRVVMGSLEEWGYPVRIDILIARAGDKQGEEDGAFPFVEAIVAELRRNVTLGGHGAFLSDATWRVGLVSAYQVTWVGATLKPTVTELFEIAALLEA
jgi:hypothetical protein